MERYYMPTLIDDNGTISILYSHDYNNGLELMEHTLRTRGVHSRLCLPTQA